MNYRSSRLLSLATAGYAGFALARPEHLGAAMGARPAEMAGYDLLARTLGVRDLAVSAFGVLGRSERTVRTAMRIRILCDVGDGVLLAMQAEDDDTRAKVLGTTLGWAALNALALTVDKRRAARR